MLNGMRLFGMGFSWGGYESPMVPAGLTTSRSAAVVAVGRTVRIHAGSVLKTSPIWKDGFSLAARKTGWARRKNPSTAWRSTATAWCRPSRSSTTPAKC